MTTTTTTERHGRAAYCGVEVGATASDQLLHGANTVTEARPDQGRRVREGAVRHAAAANLGIAVVGGAVVHAVRHSRTIHDVVVEQNRRRQTRE